MLGAVGGICVEVERLRCCDICTPSAIFRSRLDLMKPGPVARKRKVLAMELDEQTARSLRSRLEEDRQAFLDNNPDFLMIGSSFLCPDSTLAKLCTEALCIKTVDDLITYGVRVELRDRFFRIITDIVDSIPPPNRRSCH